MTDGSEFLVVNPMKGLSSFGWHFEQNVYSELSITRALKSSQGSGNIPKVIEVVKYEN